MSTIIHTCDVHLGAPLGWLGSKAGAQRDQIKKTFSKIIDLVLDSGAGCLLITGDLFDSNRPPSSIVRFAVRELARLTSASRASVVVLPGSHDYLAPDSVYATYREEFERLTRVHILGMNESTYVGIDEMGLAVHGSPPSSNRSARHQMDMLEPADEFTFNVAALHGSVDIVPTSADDHPVSTSELAKPGWSYFALGHWHSWRVIEGGSAPAVYPGAPEVIAVDQTGAGHVARVDLRVDNTEVSKVRVGSRSVMGLQLDVSHSAGVTDIAERIRLEAPPDREAVLRLILSGLIGIDSDFDEKALVELLENDYFFVSTAGSSYHVRLTDEEIERLPEKMVVGRFVRLMKHKLDAASSDDEREEIEAAMQIGVALLHGKDVLR